MKKINLFLFCLLLSGCYHCHEQAMPYSCVHTVDCFGHQAAKKYEIKFLLLDDKSNLYATKYCLFFSSSKNLELREGRRLALALANDFMDIVRADSLAPGAIAFKITFWDGAVNRPKAPYLAEILFSRGMIHYYVADPATEGLREELEESYEEAIKNSKYQRKDWSSL